MMLEPATAAYTVYDKRLAALLGAAPGARIWQRRYRATDGEVVVSLACVMNAVHALVELPSGDARLVHHDRCPDHGQVRQVMVEILEEAGLASCS